LDVFRFGAALCALCLLSGSLFAFRASLPGFAALPCDAALCELDSLSALACLPFPPRVFLPLDSLSLLDLLSVSFAAAEPLPLFELLPVAALPIALLPVTLFGSGALSLSSCLLAAAPFL
jgi:hypothetical protein